MGGMGAVYCARDMHFPNVEKLVAVKEMLNLAVDPLVRRTIVENFEREAHILATLTHPSIPKIFDYFTYDERSYLVLEYIDGEDLELMLDEEEGFFPVEKVVDWGIELCDVLRYLHAHQPEPIIFRDMKPSNVMINREGHVVLVDFGIAKNFRTGQKGTMIGTEGYSPPEQYRGEATPQADVYALGATLHHLLTRVDPRSQPPFTFAERPVRQYNPQVSEELEGVISKALQYNAADRYPSIEAMMEALIAVKAGLGSGSKISLKVNAQAVAGEGAEKVLWRFDCQDEIRGSPFYFEGVVYVGSYDGCLYAVDARDGSLMWKYASEGGIAGRPVVWESDVYFGSEDRRVYAVSLRTGKLSWLYETGAPVRNTPRLAEGHLFIGSDDGYLYAINTASTRPVWRVDAGSAIRSTPCLAEGMIVVGSEAGDVFCIDFRGQIRWRFKAKRGVTSSPTIEGGMVYFASLDAMVYALDVKTGWVTWRFRMEKGTVSSPCCFEKKIYIGSADGYIYCLDVNGREIWKYRVGHQVSGSPVVCKGFVYCGAADGNLYCLDCRNGKMRWKFSSAAAITGAPCVHDDVIYIGSHDHYLYAIMD
ncbi:MAG: serine/threonine-protein kinase [Anaerolineae bacterium]|nr:serine/threonine-protein kinase [Anaerolineae bacterium]